MALIGALLLTVILSTALGGVAMVSAIERRASAAHRLGIELRFAAEGAVTLAAEELRTLDWSLSLAGSGSGTWQMPLLPVLDLAALTQGVQGETMMETAHGADTPVWQVFAYMPWQAVSGHPGRAQVVVWVADDWQEGDGDPRRDTNGLILVRATAVAGVASAWVEALCGRETDGRVRLRHVRSW